MMCFVQEWRLQITSFEQDIGKLRNHLFQMEFPYITTSYSPHMSASADSIANDISLHSSINNAAGATMHGNTIK